MTLSYLLWLKLGLKLRKQGGGKRESGAYLLAKNSSTAHIIDFVTYLELDRHSYDTGIIDIDGSAMVGLSKLCRQKGYVTVADIHTHPGTNTSQSWSDKAHPMVRIKGHVSIIAPDFMSNPWRGLRGCGVYEYLGDASWKTHTGSNFLSLKIM